MDLLNAEGESPLSFASSNGHTNLVQALVHRGCKINHQRQDGCTPLFLASMNRWLGKIMNRIVRMYLDLVDVQNQMLVGWIMHSTVNIWICKIISRHTLYLNLEVFGFFISVYNNLNTSIWLCTWNVTKQKILNELVLNSLISKTQAKRKTWNGI